MTWHETRQKIELYILSLWFLFALIIVVTAEIPICFEAGCSFVGLGTLGAKNIVPLVSLLFALAGAFFYYRFKHRIAGSKSLSVKILSVQDLNYEHLTFLTTYIIPLICFNLGSVRYLLALGILLVVIGAIYIRTDKFYANPTLAILGFRLYQADIETRLGVKTQITLICMDKLSAGDFVDYQLLDEKIYFVRSKK